MKKFLFGLMTLAMLVFLPIIAYAQELTEIQDLVQDLLGKNGWPLTLAALLSMGMAILLGKLGFKGKAIKVPFVSEWIKSKVPKKYFPLIIMGIAATVGLFTALGGDMSVNSAISGLISGLLAGASAIGLHQFQKNAGKAIAGKE